MTLKDLLNIEEMPKVNVNGTWYEIKGECAKGILAVPSVAPYWENPPIPGIVKMEIDMILADYRSSANEKAGKQVEWNDDIDLNKIDSTTEQWEKYFE